MGINQPCGRQSSAFNVKSRVCLAATIVLCTVFAAGCDLFGKATPSVYVAGNYSSGASLVAGYWKDGVKANFADDGFFSYSATSIYVDGSDVYVAGSRHNSDTPSKSGACYWKNGVRHDLTEFVETEDARIESIAVSGGIVYAAGTFYEDPLMTACYWVDGVKHHLDSGGLYARATGISVSGGHVYVSGYISGTTDVACYWKDDVVTLLPAPDPTEDSQANSIAVSGSNVYVAGHRSDGSNNVACYWKNNASTKTDLPGEGSNDTEAYSISVSGSTVYIAGYYYSGTKGIACYWKNAVLTPLPGGANSSEANSIFPFGGKVYTAGYSADSIKIPSSWTDSVRTDLPTGGTVVRGSAKGIFVK